MLFTIAIPTYNSENSVIKALDSAIRQNYDGDYEIIVIDNCSNDNTAALVKNLNNPNVKLYINDNNIGMYGNHNKCLSEANGDYVIFCHSDDILTVNALTIIEKHISSDCYPDKYVIWGRSLYRDFGKFFIENGGDINNVFTGIYSCRPFLHQGLTPSGTCFSKKSFLELGGFVECDHPLEPSDMVTMLMLSLNGFEFKMIDRLLYERTTATTMKENTDYKHILDSITHAVGKLESSIGRDNFRRYLEPAFTSTRQPFLFYYACIKNSFFKKEIRRFLIRQIFIKPWSFFTIGFLRILIKR